MTNNKIFLPFALTTLVALLQGCGGESTKINEDPNKGVSGVTTSTSCTPTSSDCLPFAMDYPISGLNFDCSSDKANHFATKLDSNAVGGACKLGDTATFYIQGKDARKINLGIVKLDDISKINDSRYPVPRLRVIDLASALTGKMPTALDPNDETIRVAIALIKIFHSIGLEQEDNALGDIQPTQITNEKKDLLSQLTKDIGVAELSNGSYVDILKPWLSVSNVTDEQAMVLLQRLLNLSNAGVWQTTIPFLKAGTITPSVKTPDGFFGCNQSNYNDCVNPDKGNDLIHSMGEVFLLTDRQGYTIGTGQQWRGPASFIEGKLYPPLVLITKVKAQKVQINPQNTWLNPINREINSNQPLRFALTTNPSEDLKFKQGKLINDHTIPGTEYIYRVLLNAKDTDPVNTAHLGQWEQTIGGQAYNGSLEIYKANPPSYLGKDVFKTSTNVKTNQKYIFPLYATLIFGFSDNSIPDSEKIKLGIVIDENGDIRTDIRKNSTSSDMSGECAKIQSINSDGTITDEFGETQYRIGSTGATSFTPTSKSVSVRAILSNPKFGVLNGAMFGLNVGVIYNETIKAIGGAKINIHNLLSDAPQKEITLTDFTETSSTVYWSNTYAYYQGVYVNLYDNLKDTDKNNYVKPTDEDRKMAKRWTGPVTIQLADQNLNACKAVKIK